MCINVVDAANIGWGLDALNGEQRMATPRSEEGKETEPNGTAFVATVSTLTSSVNELINSHKNNNQKLNVTNPIPNKSTHESANLRQRQNLNQK